MKWLDEMMKMGLRGDRVLVQWHGPGDPPQRLIDDPMIVLLDARSAEDRAEGSVVGSGERSRSEQDTRLNEEFAEWMRKGGEDDD